MSQANDLLNTVAANGPATYSVNPGVEPHIVITDERVIVVPDELKKIAVLNDHNMETVTFDCPRYWDGIDMSSMTVFVNYMLSDGTPGSYMAHDVEVDTIDDQVLHFSWTVTGSVTKVAGEITLWICIKEFDISGNPIRRWHTELNREMYISPGFCNTMEEYSDIMTQASETIEKAGELTKELEDFAVSIPQEVEDKVAEVTQQLKDQTDNTITRIQTDAQAAVDRANAIAKTLEDHYANGDFEVGLPTVNAAHEDRVLVVRDGEWTVSKSDQTWRSLSNPSIHISSDYTTYGYLLEDGSVMTDPGFVTSDYMNIEGATSVSITAYWADDLLGTKGLVIFYDSDKNVISAQEATGEGTVILDNKSVTLTVPADATYVRSTIVTNTYIDSHSGCYINMPLSRAFGKLWDRQANDEKLEEERKAAMVPKRVINNKIATGAGLYTASFTSGTDFNIKYTCPAFYWDGVSTTTYVPAPTDKLLKVAADGTITLHNDDTLKTDVTDIYDNFCVAKLL
jgi:hypothetical protein